ncbi:MAG: helix-turn-helix transcriptional regulator [Actinomycetales bacterium]
MSAQRTERLLNLVIALLATRRWLTKEQIRVAVPQYASSTSEESFNRMFERDKDDLRELGVPLETGSHDPLFEDEPGYRIDADAYALPPITFTPAELTVLALAANVWQQANLAGPAARGLVKLKALGVSVGDVGASLQTRVLTREPSFPALYAATRDRAPVSFGYLKQHETEPVTRRVEPWHIVNWHGRWYLHGYDRDRQDDRVFRLSRIAGRVRRIGEVGTVQVPDGIDSRTAVRSVWADGPARTAVLVVDPGRGVALRRRAGVGAEAAEIEVTFTDLDQLAGEVAELGPAAQVLAPQDLRAEVLRRLRAAAGRPDPQVAEQAAASAQPADGASPTAPGQAAR